MDELPRRPRRAVLAPTAGNPLPSTPWVREVARHLAACGVRVEYLGRDHRGPRADRVFPLVHANRGRQERYARLIAAYGDRYEFVPINDDEAVTVTGETWQRQASVLSAC
jgi:hypothetical protein